MRHVLAPEPVDWLKAVEGEVWAPWALGVRGPGGFLRRRFAPGAHRQPGWTLLEGAARLWAGRSTSRGMRARFALRGLAGRWTCANLLETEKISDIVAPSLAALELFARHPGRKILLMDLPLLRQLHADLDRAAEVEASPYLHLFRAPREVVVRQEQELALADEVWVRGRYLATRLEAQGIRCQALPQSEVAAATRGPERGKGILLAGVPAARHGITTLLAALERHPDWSLHLSRPPLEPNNLLAHPQVRYASHWEGVGVVAAPSWVECYPREVREGFARGLPVVATDRAAGFTPVREVAPGDVPGLEQALVEALSGEIVDSAVLVSDRSSQ